MDEAHVIHLVTAALAGLAAFFLWPRRAEGSVKIVSLPTPPRVDRPPERERHVSVRLDEHDPHEPDFAWETSARAAEYIPAFRHAEARHGLPLGLLSRVAFQESRFDPAARSPAGAIGLMQIMPPTAADLGIDPLDPYASIDAAGRYLRQLHERFGTWPLALAAYNWGQGNLSRKGFGGAPLETREYVESISADLGIS